MPIIAAAVAVDDDPVVTVVTDSGVRLEAVIKNTGPSDVYLGGSGVTSAAGFPLAAGETMAYTTPTSSGDDALYGVCATGQSAALRVLTMPGA